MAYAAAAGTTAADGTGRNSPYTSALLAYLEQPLELSALFRRVRAQVLDATRGEQRPHEYASLLDEHYLRGASGSGTVTAAAQPSSETRAQQETVFWQSLTCSSFPTASLRGWRGTAWRSWARARATRRWRNNRGR